MTGCQEITQPGPTLARLAGRPAVWRPSTYRMATEQRATENQVTAVADTDIEALTRADLPADWTDLDRRAVDTVRVLAADAVQKVGNGHPGTAMSLAPLAYTLFQRVMRHDPSDPDWIGRDRFVLSAGHSSLTLYIQLYLSGYGLELDDLEALRTWGSQTPGHPEHRHTRGVEITTGPLGQGLASAVGHGHGGPPRARPVRPGRRARREPVRPPHLRHRLRRRHRGGRHLRGLLAGRHPAAGQPHRHLRRQQDLHRGRHHDRAVRGHRQALRGLRLARAGRRGRRERHRHPGGAGERQGRDPAAVVHPAAHRHRLPGAEQDEHRQGARLGAGRRRGRRGQEDPRLRPGADLRGRRRGARARPRGRRPRPARRTRPGRRPSTTGRPASRSARSCSTGCSAGSCRTAGRRRCRPGRPTPRAWPPARPPARCSRRWPTCCPSCGAARPTWPRATTPRWRAPTRSGPTSIATKMWDAHPYGRTLHFGVREHAMGSILNGIALHGPTRPYGGTFLVFSDYMRPAVRLAALMKTSVDLRLDARLDRPRRGRADPPADRAPGRAARHPGPGRDPPRRRQRDRVRLAGRAGAPGGPQGPGADPAEPARRWTAPRPRAWPAAATCWPRPPPATRR